MVDAYLNISKLFTVYDQQCYTIRHNRITQILESSFIF